MKIREQERLIAEGREWLYGGGWYEDDVSAFFFKKYLPGLPKGAQGVQSHGSGQSGTDFRKVGRGAATTTTTGTTATATAAERFGTGGGRPVINGDEPFAERWAGPAGIVRLHVGRWGPRGRERVGSGEAGYSFPSFPRGFHSSSSSKFFRDYSFPSGKFNLLASGDHSFLSDPLHELQ